MDTKNLQRVECTESVGGEGTVQLLQNDSRLDVFLQTIQEIENVDSWLQLKEHCNEATVFVVKLKYDPVVN